MSDSIRVPATESREPRRRGTMRSFAWKLEDGEEISPCPDCVHWHCRVEDMSAHDHDWQADLWRLREWHEADCQCWSEARD